MSTVGAGEIPENPGRGRVGAGESRVLAIILRQTPNSSRCPYVNGPWGQIHVYVDGPPSDAAPTVVFLHRMPWNGSQYLRVQPLLAEKGIRSISVDLPGYGMSKGPGFVPDVYEYADVLLPVMTHFGLEKMYLAGDHTGASIVVAFAERYPDKLHRLIVHGPPIFDAESLAMLKAVRAYEAPKADGSHLTNKWSMLRRTFDGKSTVEEQHQSLMQFMQAGPNEWYAHEAIYNYDLVPVIKTLTVPVLIITNPGDSLHDAALQMHDLRPDFDFVELDVYGTHAIFDAAEQWADGIAAYIK